MVFGAVVDHQDLRQPTIGRQPIEDPYHALPWQRAVDLERQVLPTELVDDVEGAKRAAARQGVAHEVHRPGLVESRSARSRGPALSPSKPASAGGAALPSPLHDRADGCACVLGLPPVQGLFADSVLPAKVRPLLARLRCLQHLDALLLGEPTLLHRVLPAQRSRRHSPVRPVSGGHVKSTLISHSGSRLSLRRRKGYI